MSIAPAPLVVVISGRGSNLQAILDAQRAGQLPIALRAVISNNPSAPGLEIARAAGLTTEIVDHRDYPERAGFDRALRETIDRHDPRLVVLAGFMRILGADFIDHFAGRLINVHPSLLPAFRGLNTHTRALAAGARQHGASVHFVSNEVDGGPIIVQAPVPVRPDDDAAALAARVLEQEHRILPLAIRWYLEGRLSVRDGRVLLDGQRQPQQGLADAAHG